MDLKNLKCLCAPPPKKTAIFFLFFFHNFNQIVIPGWTAGGVCALWVSEHPLWQTRYILTDLDPPSLVSLDLASHPDLPQWIHLVHCLRHHREICVGGPSSPLVQRLLQHHLHCSCCIPHNLLEHSSLYGA